MKNIITYILNKHQLLLLMFGVYILILTWLLLREKGGDLEIINFNLLFSDKIAHILSFSLLTLLGGLVFKNITIGAIFSVGYGVLMEFAQEQFTINRHFSFSDIVADVIGMLIGVLFYFLLMRVLRKHFL